VPGILEFGNGRFVAVGNSGSAYSSTNGVSWESHPVGIADRLVTLSFNSGYFVGATAKGTLGSSPDGIHWTVNTSLEVDTWTVLPFGDQTFALFGSGSLVYESDPLVETAPNFLQSPGSALLSQGSTWSARVAVSGSSPLRYQWFHESEPVAGATNDTLEILDVQFDDAGDYSVRVTNDLGTAETAPFQIEVAPYDGLLQLQIVQRSGLVSLELTGTPGATCVLRSATDLEDNAWTDVTELTFTSPWITLSTNPASGARLFWQLRKNE
jgi:hypothetical protein